MNTRGRFVTAVSIVGQVLAGLVLAAPPAYAQSVVSSRITLVSGTVAPSAALALADAAAENVLCAGAVKITTKAVSDPLLPPGVVVSIDARGLFCVGQSTRAPYVNTGQASLTRLLVPNDVIKTTFAVYRDVPAGSLKARTALLTLSLSYDTTTGALTRVTGRVGNLP